MGRRLFAARRPIEYMFGGGFARSGEKVEGKRILLLRWAGVWDGRAKPFGPLEAQISPLGEQMLQILASAQTVLLSKVTAESDFGGLKWDDMPID